MRGRSTRWWLWPALACLALVVAVSGAAGTEVESTAPAYAMVSQANLGSQTLVRLDPRTLKPLAGGLPVPQGLAFGSRSPDGRSAAYFNYQRPSLRIVDLEKLRNRGDIAVAPAGWKARATGWLTADRVAVVVQKMRGSYGQIVDRREVVLVDPFAGRVVSRHALSAGRALNASVSGGDKLVLLLGRGDARTRVAQIVIVDAAGETSTVKLDLGVPRGLRLPYLVVSLSGERAYVVATGAPVYEIDLSTLQATPHMLAGAGAAVLAAGSSGQRQAVLLDDGKLAITGSNVRRIKGVEVSRAAGLALVDTSTWHAQLSDRDVSGVSASGDTLLGYSTRIERVLHNGRPIQKLSGIGLRGYAANGSRRWQRYGGQPLLAQAFRGSALVHRSPSPPIGSGGNFVVSLSDGHTIRVENDRGPNLSLLPDVPDAPPVRAPSAASVPALEIEGTGERFTGTAQPQITRVVASLVDGSERELTIDAGTVSYQAPSPNESARTVHAYAGDQLVTSITLAVACGGSIGPCPAVAPLSTTSSSTATSTPPSNTTAPGTTPNHQATPGKPPTAASRAAASAAAQPDPFATISNHGTRVEPKAATPREREYTPKDVFLLRRAEGRAIYRISGLKPGYSSCFASGSGDEIGRLGGIGCLRGFPSRAMPVQRMAVMNGRPGGQGLQLVRVEGVAADAVAEIGLTDRAGHVIARVPVEGNVYVLAHPPSGATGDYLVYDTSGTVVFDSRRRAQQPPPAANPRTLAGFRLKITVPKGWSGEISRPNAGPARTVLFASNRLPSRNPSSMSIALVERDPRERPAYPMLSTAPQIARADIRTARSGYRGIERRFTLHGRQFHLQITFGRARPTPAQLQEINRMLATLAVGAIAVQKAPSGTPLQHGSDHAVAVDVHRSGAVVFHFDPASPLYHQLQGKNVSVSCLTFDSTSPWQPNETGSSAKRLAETVQVLFGPATQHPLPYATLAHPTEAEPPFDGCLVGGSYGRRWNDPHGQHSPAEIAFTATGKRFFDERAVARDLALFVRSPKLAAARSVLKQGGSAPAATALIHGLPDRVTVLKERDRPTASGEIGVWTDQRDLIEVSARTPAGKRLYIEIRDGHIAQHNLQGLAFVS